MVFLYKRFLPISQIARVFHIISKHIIHTITLHYHELSDTYLVNWSLPKGTQVDILVENLGRVNYGQKMMWQRKGIDGAVLLDGQPLRSWEIRSLPMENDNLAQFSFAPFSACKQSAFLPLYFECPTKERGYIP